MPRLARILSVTLIIPAFIGTTALTAGAVEPAPVPFPGAPADGVVVTGAAGVATVDAAALQRLSRVQVEVSYETDKGMRKPIFEGPLLWDVLVYARAVDPAAPRGMVRQVVLLEGRDNYTAVLALGELAPAFEGKQVILCDRMDGVALAPAHWRIVVAGDRRGGRSVHDIALIAVMPAPPAPAPR